MLTTHYIEEADNLADRVLVLAGGHVIADATPHELRTRGGAQLHQVARCPIPARLPACPRRWTEHVTPDGRAVVIRDADVTAALRELVAWAGSRFASRTQGDRGRAAQPRRRLPRRHRRLTRTEAGSDG